MPKINAIKSYIPPRTLGEGLRRVKEAMHCTGEVFTPTHGFRLYKSKDFGTVYMTTGVLHKTPQIVPQSKKLSCVSDYTTYAGTVLRIRNSAPAGKMGTKPNQLLQLMRTKFYSKEINESGIKSKPLFAVTDFGIINSKDGKPIVKYGYGKHRGQNGIAGTIKEIKNEAVPKEYKGINAPDGNIVYYLRDTISNGERSVEMKMFETGLDVRIL